MEIKTVSSSGSGRLILLFAGWAMDWRPFSRLVRPGYDIAVVWDYRTFGADWSFAGKYGEICLVAWSLGVAAASVAIPYEVRQKVTLRLAVDGTMTPVDAQAGIPPEIFAGTRNGLSRRSLDKFYYRVCGSREAFAAFCADKPVRDIAGLADELDVFLHGCQARPARWDRALISAADAIFPPENQRRAWRGVPTSEISGPHFPDFQRILDTYVIDKGRTESRFLSGARTYDDAASVQHRVASRLVGGLDLAAPRAILEVGSGTGYLSRLLAAGKSAGARLEMWDLAGECPPGGDGCSFRRGDAELLIRDVPDASLDLIVSASTVQWFNSPLRFLEHCARVLRPGGTLALSTFVAGNLAEVSEITDRSLPVYTASQWQSVHIAGLSGPEAEDWTETLAFDSAIDIFRHLKATGVNSLGRTTDSGGALRRAIGRLMRGPSGKFELTYRPIILKYKRIPL